MNPPKFTEDDYMAFLTASPRIFTCTEAERVLDGKANAPAHDAINRVLHRISASALALREEAKKHVNLKGGVLILDDTTLDKPYAQQMELVCRHWSGKHHKVVKGINLITLLWTDGDISVPCDYRIYNKDQDGKTKNDHFVHMLEKAKKRGADPAYILFDSWYASLENLKFIRDKGWCFLSRLKPNRLVNPDSKGNIPVSSAALSDEGNIVHLKGYGFVKVFKIVTKEDNSEYWVTNDLDMDDLKRLQLSEFSWKIEDYHRGLKQFCGVERSHARSQKAQRNHIGLAIRTFLRFAVFCFKNGCSWFEAKYQIIRKAIRDYIENPLYDFEATA